MNSLCAPVSLRKALIGRTGQLCCVRSTVQRGSHALWERWRLRQSSSRVGGRCQARHGDATERHTVRLCFCLHVLHFCIFVRTVDKSIFMMESCGVSWASCTDGKLVVWWRARFEASPRCCRLIPTSDAVTSAHVAFVSELCRKNSHRFVFVMFNSWFLLTHLYPNIAGLFGKYTLNPFKILE